MTFLAAITGFKQTMASNGTATPATISPTFNSPGGILRPHITQLQSNQPVMPAAAATTQPDATPVHSAGGQIPLPVPIAPYVASAPATPTAPSKAIDKKWLIIGAAVLLVLFVFILRR